ncbi:MAG: 1-deoxy-D-xylulose-5-phosphate synthase [Clostridiales bacterium]|nr:1-deoxy-D-xylulose-5-phosphate synthase [Clostridiales bacterium]
MRILDKIKLPEDLKSLDIQELNILADDLREVITKYTLSNGGHLASNLGVVDLTCALNYVFDFPKDKLIFDVGHQCYAYKILSGRLEEFKNLRQKDGLNGFPKREESPFDTFNSGHASTALSIACGMARGGESGQIVCLIGDGAMTGGIFYEALNDVLTLDKKVIIIINDNNKSISDNVGFVNDYLKIVRKYGDEISYMNIETLNNIDGHNMNDLIDKFNYAKNSDKSIILHVVTQKGKGMPCAEENPCKYHSVGKPTALPCYGQVFGETLIELAKNNKDIYAVTAAMAEGTGLSEFEKTFPDRITDVGIAEEHAVTMSAGLALAGKKPYVAIYSTFLQRAYDNVLHDVCLTRLPVVFCIDRAGFVGGDGETHQGLYDVAYLGSMPNMSIYAPKDGQELKSILKWSQDYNLPLAIRYPKSEIATDYDNCMQIEYGKWEYIVKGGSKNVLISNGEILSNVLKASEILKANGIDVDVVNARFIKPIDKEMLSTMLDGKNVFIFEEYISSGSVYAQTLEFFNQTNHTSKVYGVNVENKPYMVASRSELIQSASLDVDSIVNFVISKN